MAKNLLPRDEVRGDGIFAAAIEQRGEIVLHGLSSFLQQAEARDFAGGQGKDDRSGLGVRAGFFQNRPHDASFLLGLCDDEDDFLFLRDGNGIEFFRLVRAGALAVQNGAAGGAGASCGVHHKVGAALVGDGHDQFIGIVQLRRIFRGLLAAA